MGWKYKAKQILQNAKLLPLYDAFGGLSEFWVAVFSTATIVLAFKGKLDGNFALAITAITGILTAHDALDDYHSRHERDSNNGVDSPK